jgi:hypothetical protein
MSTSGLLNPAAALLACLCVSGCGVEVQNDGHMFQRWADQVEKIPVAEDAPGAAAAPNPGDPMAVDPVQASKDLGLRPPMTIAVVDRINMPNAKEAGMRMALGMVSAAAGGKDAQAAGLRPMIDAVAPMVLRRMADAAGARPAAPKTSGSGKLVQLAAFPSDTAAHAAWHTLAAAHPDVFAGLAPRFEKADLGSKGVWTRVKVGPLKDAASGRRVCAAAKLSPERCV